MKEYTVKEYTVTNTSPTDSINAADLVIGDIIFIERLGTLWVVTNNPTDWEGSPATNAVCISEGYLFSKGIILYSEISKVYRN